MAERIGTAIEGSGAAAATSTSSVVAVANGSRRELGIVNESDGEVWLALGETAVAHQGVYLRPYGGTFWTGGDVIFTGAVNCIQEGGGSLVLSYYEY